MAKEIANTFKLPRGEKIRREQVAIFRRQRAAILRFLATGKKDDDYDMGGRMPGSWPKWDDFGFGALKLSERMTPLLRVHWDKGGKDLFKRVGLDPDEWKVTNPNTAEAIAKASLSFCEETNKTTSLSLDDALAKTREELREGVINQGEALPKLVKRVNAVFDGAEKWRAKRIAWTEASRAVHAAGEMAAYESEVVTGWEWLLSSDACPLCQTVGRRAKYVKLGQPFAIVGDHPEYSQVRFPPLHPHCLLPETPILAPGGIAGIEVHYNGPIVRLEFSDGSKFAVTPNHMLLTPTGFARAKSLSEFDHVVRCEGSDRVPFDGPNENDRPPQAKDVVRTLSVSRGMTTTRVPVSPEYIHGDAIFCDGEINVVRPNGEFSDNGNRQSVHGIKESSLVCAHCGRIGCSCDCDLADVLETLRLSTDGGVRSTRESHADLWSGSAHSEVSSFGPVSDLNASLNESPAYSGAAYFERISDCLFRFTRNISVCHVTKIESSHYVGPVYDVQTTSTLYALGNGIASSNCNCTVVEVLDTDKQPEFAQTLVQPEPEPEDEPVIEERAKRWKSRPKPLPPKTFKYKLILPELATA